MQDTYTIGDREFKLRPLKGRKARRMMPQLLEIAAAALNLAAANGVDLTKIFTAEGVEPQLPSFAALTQASIALARYFKDEYDDIEQRVFPVLLCAEDSEWIFIDEESTPGEMYGALWVAIQYHLKTSFGIEVQQALKNLQEQAEAEQEEVVEEGTEEAISS